MEMVNLTDKEKIWKYISHLQKLNEIYHRDFGKTSSELESKISEIKTHLERKKESKIDIEKIRLVIVIEWKKVINNAISDLLKTIKSRKTRGSEFVKIIDQLKKIKEDIKFEEFDLEVYERIYENDLSGLKEQIKEKLTIEGYHKKTRWIDRILGLIIGITVSLLIWFLQTL